MEKSYYTKVDNNCYHVLNTLLNCLCDEGFVSKSKFIGDDLVIISFVNRELAITSNNLVTTVLIILHKRN